MPAVGSGGVAGTTGKNLNLEGLRVFLDGVTGSDLQIRAHVSSIGWQDCVSEGAVAGTVGKNLPIEALQIKLTGEASAAFDVWYRVHSADFGWGGWASNGASAGSQGFAKAAQAIEVRLVPKGQGAPGDTPDERFPGTHCNLEFVQLQYWLAHFEVIFSDPFVYARHDWTPSRARSVLHLLVWARVGLGELCRPCF